MGKQRFACEEAYEVADALMKLAAVAPITANTVRDAMTVGLRYDLNHWDSLILAAAVATKADAAVCAAQWPSYYASGALSSNSRAMATARARLASAKE
jgi:hypothetical protein